MRSAAAARPRASRRRTSASSRPRSRGRPARASARRGGARAPSRRASPAASRKPVTTLRGGIVGFLRRLLRGRPALPGRRLLDRAQARLQVVEDEPDGRLGRGRRRDQTAAVADDEDAAVDRRRLELGDVRARRRSASSTSFAAAAASRGGRRFRRVRADQRAGRRRRSRPPGSAARSRSDRRSPGLRPLGRAYCRG